MTRSKDETDPIRRMTTTFERRATEKQCNVCDHFVMYHVFQSTMALMAMSK